MQDFHKSNAIEQQSNAINKWQSNVIEKGNQTHIESITKNFGKFD